MDSEDFHVDILDVLSDYGSDMELEDSENDDEDEGTCVGVISHQLEQEAQESEEQIDIAMEYDTSSNFGNLIESESLRLLQNSYDSSSSDSDEENTPIWTDGEAFIPQTGTFIPSPGGQFDSLALDSTATPFDILKKFLKDDIIVDIIRESNCYAELIKLSKPKALTKWKNMEEKDFWLFLALKTLSGLVKKNSMRDYWSTDPLLSTPIWGETMPRQRYEDLDRCLHFSDNNTNPPNDRLAKLGTLYPKLMQNFREAIKLSEHLCIDESLMKYKGRLSFRQYNPKKQAKFGIKLFELVDKKTKFLVNLNVYLGKKTSYLPTASVAEYGSGGATVITLLNPYLWSHHRVTVDNFFTSPKLARFLQGKDTYLLGTVKRNRKDMPKFTGKLKQGEFQSQTDGKLLVERWQDRREVLMLNNFIRHEMQPSTSQNPRNSRDKPVSVLQYNKLMGGVDDIDRQISPYDPARKTIKWYKKLAFHLFDLAIYNSFVVFKNLGQKNEKVSFKEFKLKLIREILGKFKIEKNVGGRPRIDPQESRLVGSHWPERVVNEQGNSKNSNCHFCYLKGQRKGTHFRCKSCKKYLCIDACFEEFHTVSILPTRTVDY